MIALQGKGLFMVSSGWNQWRQRALSAGIAVGAALCLSASTLGTLPVAALGLGEIDTRSALNERFAAEIELLDTRGLDASEVLASLASTDDFRRVGVERFFFLTSLKFEVTRNARGNLVIKATSQQPITEPYLNFLVEVLWPSGRLLKEYTVLLDPPTFTHSAAAPVAAPSREQTDVATAGRIQRDPTPVTDPAATSGVSAPARSSGAASGLGASRPQVSSNDGTYGRTTRSDTMWAIANETLPSTNVTPQQNMLAIQRLNPTAFIDGNVNLLKAGVVLRLPSEAEVSAIPNSSAVAEIDAQNQAWRTGAPSRAVARSDSAPEQTGTPAPNAASTDAATIDATTRGPGDAGKAPTANDGRLRIVADESTGPVDSIDNAGSSDSATATVGDPAAEERLAEMARQVDELTYQLDLQKRGVEEQISEREKTINLKDQQIAQLEAQLKVLRENANNAQQQDQSTSQTAQEEATPWWQQAPVLGSALGGLALLLAGVLFSRRRRAADDLDLDDMHVAEPSFELGTSAKTDTVTPLADADLLGDLDDADSALDIAATVDAESDLADGLSAPATNEELSDDELFGPADDAAPAQAATPTGDSPQTSDVIGEADIYIAYGRYPQAVALLQGAVETNPQDHAVRMRLLEISAETNDAESYAEHSAALREHCSDTDTLATADALYNSLDDDFRTSVDAISDLGGDDAVAGAALVAGAGTAIAAGAASVFGDDDSVEELSLDDEVVPVEDSFRTQEVDATEDFTLEADAEIATLDDGAEPFAFDTTVTEGAADDLANSADALLTGEFGGVEATDTELAADLAALDAQADESKIEGEFELDLDTEIDADLDALTDEIAADAAADFDQPAVDTDQFSTNVDITPADEVGSAVEDVVDDFEFDLDIEEPVAESAEVFDPELADDIVTDSLGGDLGLDFPDETAELERVVAETDDDQLLDEIERSLDELEADGLLTPELSEEGDFSFDDDADTSATKLDLARAYIDMGDDDGAREILGEVISEGDTSQKGEANELLDKL